jgi:hypothetical protein
MLERERERERRKRDERKRDNEIKMCAALGRKKNIRWYKP